MSLLKTNEIQNYNGSSLTLTASTVSTSAQLNTGGNISVTGSLNVSDDSTTRTNLGLGTIATQDSDSITVTGGTATLSALEVSSSVSGSLIRVISTGGVSRIQFETPTSDDMISVGAEGEQLVLRTDDAEIVFRTNENTEHMRIDSSGNVLVGKTTNDYGATAGISLNGDTDRIYATKSGGNPIYVNRLTSDGDLIVFRKDGTDVGSIGVNAGNNLYISSADADHAGVEFSFNAIVPQRGGSTADNIVDLGTSSIKFDDIYATNGTIQTSDRNEKQDIEELSEAEQRVAVAAKALMRKFRWKSAVAKKGDEARIHFGIIAQDLQAAFEAEGLDAGRYGMFMSNTWWETSETYTDDEGVEQTRTNTYDTAEEAPEGAVERTRLGIRYSELLAFIIAAI